VRCLKCREDAWVELRRHNAAYCNTCFVGFFHDQVERAIRSHRMFTRDDNVLVAVSGGKDSLALWDVLLDGGYRADGLYIDLGIGEYSAESKALSETFAASRNATLHVVGLQEEFGYTIDLVETQTGRKPCSGCGLTKRYLFNRRAAELGYDVVATGHNLDDEAATLLGNVVHWQTGYLSRQSPVLEAEEAGLVRKVKPLYRLSEHETASYAVIRGIDYVVDECPNAVGARSLLYKDALNVLEERSPGSKQAFLLGFLERAQSLFANSDQHELQPCTDCGQPTTTPRCAFCRLVSDMQGPVRRRRGRRRRRPAPSPAGRGLG
jgi:tRNA-5-methyluridine54 2-sulfurtransferase